MHPVSKLLLWHRPRRTLLPRLRCPSCHTTFESAAGAPKCPSCGFTGTVAGSGGNAPVASAPRERRIPAWTPIAVFAIVMLLIVALITVRFDGADAEAPEPGLATPSTTGTPDAPLQREDLSPDQDPSQVGTITEPGGDETPELRLSGGGEGTSGAFQVNGGLLRASLFHSGTEGLFSVRFVDQQNDSQSHPFLGATEPGRYEADRFIGLDASTYVLEVVASGSWEVVLRYPDVSGAREGTGDLRVSGPSTPAPVLLSGNESLLRFVFDGVEDSSLFDVVMYDWRGNRLHDADCGAHGVGDYDRTKSCPLLGDGPYFFDVAADGSWRIEYGLTS